MIGVTLTTVVVLLAQAPAVEPSDLVAQLGASRYADRQAASSALEKLGRRALPALRAARDQRDPEVRARAAAVLGRIEGALLTQASSMSFDFEEAPLADVVRSFGEQTGVKLTLFPENSPKLLGRRVTIREPRPLPFWKAVDRLCAAAGLQYNFGMQAFPNGREATFPLFEGASHAATPVSDSGPFRVSLVRVHYESDVSFQGAPQFVPRENMGAVGQFRRPTSVRNEQFYAQMQVAGEPRLSLIQNAPLRLIEAVDEKGNPLATPTPGGPEIRRSGYFGFGTGSVIQFQAALVRPKVHGSAIQRLKGVVPVLVSTRKPNPLVVPLSGASGRTFQNEEVALTVHDLRVEANNHPQTLQVTIRPATVVGGESREALNGIEAVAARPDTFQQQLEVVDAQGHAIPWYQSSMDSEAGRLTLSLTSPEQAAGPAELRYYSLIRASTEIPFEFNDVRDALVGF